MTVVWRGRSLRPLVRASVRTARMPTRVSQTQDYRYAKELDCFTDTTVACPGGCYLLDFPALCILCRHFFTTYFASLTCGTGPLVSYVADMQLIARG